MTDVRDVLFRDIGQKRFHATLTAERAGVLCGKAEALAKAAELGVELEICKEDGDDLSHGQVFANFSGTPKQIAMAEEQLIGVMAKASGIATAARTAVLLADGKIRIVSGAWKKMPPELKNLVRKAVTTGGAAARITDPPMIYMDKNFVRMLGSVRAAMEAAAQLDGAKKIVQLRGETASIADEARQAAAGGANIVMVDTGRQEDLIACVETLKALGCREKMEVAFAGNLTVTDIPHIAALGADAVDIGREIIDAPLLDMRLDVVGEDA